MTLAISIITNFPLMSSNKRGVFISQFLQCDMPEKVVYQKLKRLDDVIFRVLASGVGVIKMNYFSMFLLKIETKACQFCFELKHNGILNEKRFKNE